MKKSLVATAALALAGTASAQTSVTLFGVIDTTISGYSNQSKNALGTSSTVSQTILSNSGYSSSRVGFRGTEDLGGGLAATFWLEAGINTDDGTGTGAGGGLVFNRRSTVSLSNNLGELRLGRDYTPTYWNDNLFDPFGVNGVGTNLLSTANGQTSPGSAKSGFGPNSNYSRASNSLGYFLPANLGGVYGQLMYAFNENTSYDPGGVTPPGITAVVANPALGTADNGRAGRYIGGRVGYTSGALDVAAAYGTSTYGSNFYVGTTSLIDIWSIGGTYDFGILKLFAEYGDSKPKIDTSNPLTVAVAPRGFKGGLLGATVPVGPGLVRLSYSAVRYDDLTGSNVTAVNTDQKADKFAIGYVYNFSKRTALYATYGYVSNKNGAGLTVGGPLYYTGTVNGFASVPDHSQGYDLGIRHSF